MQTKIFAAIFLFAPFGATQDLDLDDFPRACQQACQDISRLSNDCDNQTSSDRDEINCVCNGNNAEEQARNCAACVKANVRGDDDDDDDDDDLVDVFRACGWNYDEVSSTTTSGTASSTASTSSVITTTETFPASTTTNNESGTSTTETFPASTVTSTEPASPSNTESDTPDNAAAGVTAGVRVVAAGLMAALPVIL
ncbi:hypothetical protein F5B22DRAFT_613509 [Xylaria bambusicola]|uniref:uncharacterized protein n=1 Tax=Xylaria bambusicola TaxID=326684 RepID=UPI002007F292|nr:uncharacterized protein F5B22DRAFT_613509 [Xylaria bambusicola]KAI0512865.1 hypothetical protein F5B22DRAFT_613509 [Xylaria bambusicola]